jgi:hypothetical protein
MVTPEEILKNSAYDDEILELIDNQDDYTRSDLQGRVGAIVLNIVRETREATKATSPFTFEDLFDMSQVIHLFVSEHPNHQEAGVYLELQRKIEKELAKQLPL